ncbi:MAG: trypsin-like serine protease [Deltaproteobacteria bacterium]|nr:trypsin-like serine protease [Deltaproteobacteria bacterium]MCW5809301.1 trypsin-like serine protease [Deltaproteobacteria bacterium]
MRARWLSLWLLTGCVTELDLSSVESEVIGGQRTAAGKFAGVGALMYDFGGGQPMFGCTGTLIAPDAVLTAAHCVDPQLVGDGVPGFTLALDTNAGPVTVTPGRMKIKHEQFALVNPGRGLGEFHDVGIVLLAQPITEVAPVPMVRPQDSAALAAGLAMEIVGYGRTSTQTNDGGVMFDAATQLISINPSELQVGMGSPQPQNCNGDSGGPGFATIDGVRRIIGTVSRSFDGNECVNGGVDTRVDTYLPWIHSKITTGIPCDSGMAEPCPVPEEDEDGGGCCSGSRGAPGGALLAFALGGLLLRRRR